MGSSAVVEVEEAQREGGLRKQSRKRDAREADAAFEDVTSGRGEKDSGDKSRVTRSKGIPSISQSQRGHMWSLWGCVSGAPGCSVAVGQRMAPPSVC